MRTKSIAKSNPVFDVTSNPLRTGNDARCEDLTLTLTLTMSKTNELYCPFWYTYCRIMSFILL